MAKRYTVEELTCPECGFVAKNANGLRGHRQFKHGARPSGTQLPLQEQDRLVSESRLEQVLEQEIEELMDGVMVPAIEKVRSEVVAIKQQLKEFAEQRLEQPNLTTLANKVSELAQRLRQAEAQLDSTVAVGTVRRLENIVMSLADDQGRDRLLFSDNLPKGETGWKKSEFFGCYVKGVQGR